MSNENSDNIVLSAHRQVVDHLDMIVSEKRLVHSYIFVGLAGMGKDIIARHFMRSLLCTTSSSGGCKECQVCRLLSSGSSPDLFRLDVMEGETQISIDSVREWQRKLHQKPVFSQFKIGFISEAERLSAGAAHALLKTLEEPPDNTIIIMLVPSPENLLPTIVSRSQSLYLPSLSEKDLSRLLVPYCDEETAKIVTQLSARRPRRAAQLLADEAEIAAVKEAIEESYVLLGATEFDRLQRINNRLTGDFGENKIAAQKMAEAVVVAARDALLAQVGASAAAHLRGYQASTQQVSQRLEMNDLLRGLENLLLLERKWEVNANPRLAIESLLLNI
ncbi:MAG: hypothetical protein NUV82_00270 [Candidatus Komeilibacteria bacterium]|nr:hypothetical protein [Candidatus Komeilibacteria bacterium]